MKKSIFALWVVLLTFACAGKNTAPAGAQASKGGKSGKTKAEAPVDNANLPSKEGITVQKAAACQSIENRAPVGESEKFKPDVGRIYLYTQVQTTSADETSIQHVWTYNGKTMGTVTLPIRGTRWRTYSSKLIDPSWKGDWKVDVSTKSGAVIQSVSFKVE